ncbi:MAG: hypothetical protein ACYCZX_20085 [Rhodospirillaceae bacterium]
MKTMALQISALSIAVMTASPAAAAETWVQCDGAITATGADGQAAGESKPAKDVYVYDDETKHFFRYSDTRKALDLVFVTEYGLPDTKGAQIKWGSPAGSSYGDVQWAGVFDRGAMTVKLTRKEKGETMSWSESCKQIQPIS